MVLEKEWQQKMDKRFSPEEEQREESVLSSQQEGNKVFSSLGKLKSADFKHLKSKGKAFKSKYFLFVYEVSESNSSHFSVGWTLTRKVGNAVQRNRIKRLIRESIRILSKQNNLPDKKLTRLNIVFLHSLKNKGKELTFYDVYDEIFHFFNYKLLSS